MNLTLVHSTIRGDEKLLLEAASFAGVKLDLVDVRNEILDGNIRRRPDVVLQRCLSATVGVVAIKYFQALDIPVVNSLTVANICEDKFFTSLTLQRAGISTPGFALVFTKEQALRAIQELGGFPVVTKPLSGSWGRLIAKINDQDALEAIIEHKHVLGSPAQKPIYIQQYIQKPDRDIRVTVVNHQPVCAIARNSDHWITNTARGASAEKIEVDKDLANICVKTSQVIGGGVLGIDIFETDSGYSVNEVNHTVEFKNVQCVTKVNVAKHIIDYCQEVSHENR